MRKRMFCTLLIIMVLTGSCCAPLAWADEASGGESDSGAGITVEGVTLSADGMAASINGCDFALGDFARAQVGSNRAIDGAYYGYAYKVTGGEGRLSVIVSPDLAVVYIPEAASSVGFDANDEDDIAQLKRMLKVLEDENSSGKGTIADSATWEFTTEKELTVGEVVYSFDQEINGDYYDCVIGADQSDITDSSNPAFVRLNHAAFATIVHVDDVVIVDEPSWWENFTTFLSTLNWSPLWVTLRTTLTAIVFIFILGLAAAYFCLHRSPRMRNVFDTVFTIPMVLPPTVCGFLLLLLLGNNTALGRWFSDIGFPLVFSWPATVIAAVVVAFPLMYRNALGAFDNLDPNMLDAARTLGWSESRIFFKIMLPLSWSSIAAGTVLAFARALGEFGATLFLAGNYLGITRTVPIAIYFEWMNGNTEIALFWTVILLIFSFVVILFINLWSNHTTRYRKGAVDQ